VVAGEPNAGKTAWLLNVAYENQNDHEVHYFSSEMGADELKDRLLKFEETNMCRLDGWKTRFWDKSGDFADAIKPNAINIIDFLELHDKFWEIGGKIREIYDRLDRGIAIVALQKNPTQVLKDGTVKNEWGLGALRAAEKARLYFTMNTGNVAVIKKAKNWKSKVNPNGMMMRYTLAQGCRFVEKGKWMTGTEFARKEQYEEVIDDTDGTIIHGD
jgi:hypothetical protein